MREALTYDDVLIIPFSSDIESRLDISVNSKYLGGFRVPIVSAPMDTVSGPDMVVGMWRNNGYGILHRFGTPTELQGDVRRSREMEPNALFGVSIGVKDWQNTEAWLNSIIDYPIHSVCIDVAHGHHQLVVDTIKRVKEYMDIQSKAWHIIAGNVATGTGFYTLARAGADAIRVGIGPGSACTTRETTGVGMPQLTAIIDAVDAQADYPNVSIIADGGIQNPGDIAKALAAGADAVMLGKMLAGADEAEGGGMYRGQSTVGSNGLRGAPEGIVGSVQPTGPLTETIDRLCHYLRSSFSYVGARNLEEFRQRAQFVRVSPATWRESGTRLGV
jgi:IMP dehydrogenase